MATHQTPSTRTSTRTRPDHMPPVPRAPRLREGRATQQRRSRPHHLPRTRRPRPPRQHEDHLPHLQPAARRTAREPTLQSPTTLHPQATRHHRPLVTPVDNPPPVDNPRGEPVPQGPRNHPGRWAYPPGGTAARSGRSRLARVSAVLGLLDAKHFHPRGGRDGYSSCDCVHGVEEVPVGGSAGSAGQAVSGD